MQNQLHTSSQRGRQGLPSQEDAQHTTPQGLRVEQNANMFGEQLCAVVLVAPPFRTLRTPRLVTSCMSQGGAKGCLQI